MDLKDQGCILFASVHLVVIVTSSALLSLLYSDFDGLRSYFLSIRWQSFTSSVLWIFFFISKFNSGFITSASWSGIQSSRSLRCERSIAGYVSFLSTLSGGILEISDSVNGLIYETPAGFGFYFGVHWLFFTW